LYGPPGTGKTLLARALASNIAATFLKVVASAIVDKYIVESARIIYRNIWIRKGSRTLRHFYGRD
jgi:ATP-dependent 26S proteasome regulatory subunit